jgi:uncharacterized protein YukE
MANSIVFNEAALAAALSDMQALCSERFESGGSTRLIQNGIGETARALNETYATMRQIETHLNNLIRATCDALRVAGVRFPEADAAASNEFSSINGS